MKINIFNVYIVQLRKLVDLKRYATLVLGYLPFYLQSIIFRIFSFTFIMIYLSYWCTIPLAVIFLSNLFIGYIFIRDIQYDQSIKDRYKSMNKLNVEERGMAKKIRSTPGEDSPVWLNSFLGMFIPSCYIMGPLPELLDKLSADQKRKIFKEQSRFQKKIIKYQVLIANTVIVISVGIIFYLVNFTQFGYDLSTLSFIDFNICCCLIFIMAAISYMFVIEIDVLKRFHLSDFDRLQDENRVALTKQTEDLINQTKCKKHKDKGLLFKKIAVSLFCCTGVLLPPLSAQIASSWLTLPNVYIITKNDSNNNILIEVTKSQLISKNFHQMPVIKQSYRCDNRSERLIQKDKILILLPSCIHENKVLQQVSNTKDMEHELEGIAGLILLNEDKTRSSSYPWKYQILSEVTQFPVLLVNYYDKDRILGQSGQTFELNGVDLTVALSNSSSQLYTMKCPTLTGITTVHILRKTGFFLGCNGYPKIDSGVNLTCVSKNRTCPEIYRFENSLMKGNLFDQCRKREGDTEGHALYPAITCNNIPQLWDMNNFLGDKEERKWFMDIQCYNGGNRVYFPKVI